MSPDWRASLYARFTTTTRLVSSDPLRAARQVTGFTRVRESLDRYGPGLAEYARAAWRANAERKRT
jgi:hypothetical protein